MHGEVPGWVEDQQSILARTRPSVLGDILRRSVTLLAFSVCPHEASDVLNESPGIVDTSAQESLLHDSDNGDGEGQLRPFDKNLFSRREAIGIRGKTFGCSSLRSHVMIF